MKNPLKHQSAPVAARPSDTTKTSEQGHSRNHSHNGSIGHIFQGLAHRLRSDSPHRDQQQAATANSFHIVHLPDRPLVPILPSDAPSDDECRLLFQGLHSSDGLSSPRATSHQEVSPYRQKARMTKDRVPAQAQVDRTQTAMPSRAARPSRSKRASVSYSSSSRPQTSHSAVPPAPLTGSRTLPRKVTPSSPARPSTSSSSSHPRVSTTGETPVTTTNTARERQPRATQPAALSQATWSAPRVSSQPSVRSNASTAGSSTSGSSGTSGGSSCVLRGSSNGSSRSMQPRGSLRPPPVLIHVDAARSYTYRPLPQIPQSPVQPSPREQPPRQQPPRQQPPRQQPPRQVRPPAPLSARPLLPHRPALPAQELASFAERAARTQPGRGIDLPLPITALAQSFKNAQAQPSRQFHMDGQTYDEVLGPLQKELQRPSSSDSSRGRIGPWADDGGADRRGDSEVDIQKYVSIGFQPMPRSGCISLECNSLGRHYNPTPQSHGVPKQRQQQRKQSPPPRSPPPPPHQPLPRQLQPQQQPQHQRKNSQARRPELWVPRISSPLRQAHLSSPHQGRNPQQQQPPSPRPTSADISPLTPPPRSPLRDADSSPVKGVLLNGPEAVPRPTTYDTQDTAIAEALRVAEKQNGEPLLEWEIEAIKSMSGMPSQEQKKMGIVSIGSVSQKRPQPSPADPTTAAASLVKVTSTGRHAYYEAQARQAVVYENDGSSSGGSNGSSGDDYTTSWPESSYYFNSNSETLGEKPPRSQPTPSSRSNRSSSEESNSLKRQPRVPKAAEVRQMRHASQR